MNITAVAVGDKRGLWSTVLTAAFLIGMTIESAEVRSRRLEVGGFRFEEENGPLNGGPFVFSETSGDVQEKSFNAEGA